MTFVIMFSSFDPISKTYAKAKVGRRGHEKIDGNEMVWCWWVIVFNPFLSKLRTAKRDGDR